MKCICKKLISILCVFAIILPSFIPAFTVSAANPYSVVMVSNSSNNKTVGTYATYSEAVKAMNAQNSTSTSVASIYKNGKIINSRYAIFQLKPSSSLVNLYQNAGDSTAYTYTSPSYMTDAAFIDSNESRVQVMYSGFKGWVDINAGNIIPISLLGANAVNITASGLNLRESASTSSKSIGVITCTNALFTYTEKKSAGGYTWYKINYNGTTGWVANGNWLTETSGTSLNTYYYRYDTGNLLHRYGKHNGTSYTDDYTNLGPTPTYLTVGARYYSFDGGIYLYNSLTSMLDDYRNDTYTHSLNANNPNYAYYLFLPNKSVSKVTAAELDSQIKDTSSKLYGQGKYFKEAESLYGMNALSAFATAKNESSNVTSKIAKDKNNVFGYGASDSCPYDCARSYASVRDSIMDYAKNGLNSYMIAGASYYFGTHAGTKGSGRNVKYASDPLWGEKQAWNAFMTDKNQNLRDYQANTIGVTKYGKYNVPVYKEANTNNVIYNIRNSNSSFKVYNVPVTVIDKVGDFYKIYADSSSYQYGYIKTSDLNVSNNQPVINATDKTIALNSSFDPMAGVTATDAENGNLTNRITYTGSVNTSKVGTYNITYTVTDNGNFSASKTVKITVKGASLPIINATDKEVSQYTTFDYMDGVTAIDDTDGNITSKVTYDKTVDTNTKGTYSVTYSVTNSNNKTTTKTIKVTVVDNSKPIINASDKTVYLNREFDPMDGVTATDKEDGDLTKKIEVTKNNVDTSVIGEYEVEYAVTDSANQKVTKKIKVNVAEKVLKETSANFYFDYLKSVNGQLQLKGYNTINGIDNNLATNIKYKVEFKNLDDGSTIIQNADRITQASEISRPAYGSDGKDYQYSWFKINIDLGNLPDGNYSMAVISESDDYYSKSIVSNKLFKEQETGYDGAKHVIISNNYSDSNAPVEMMVRSEKIADKDANYTYNQFDQYRTFEFNDDNTLKLIGTSYSYGGDYNKNANVSRQIIFENIDNFKKYYKNLGSTTEGLYEVALPVPDGLSKTRAWYNANIDISDIPVGKYVIYIATEANISDVAEFKELLNRSLDEVKQKIGDRTYSFKVNTDKGNRIEMTVE